MIDLAEKVQVVDKDDKVVGSATKPEIWKKGLMHRIVRVMVEDAKGRILLQKRSGNMKLYANCWDQSAGGHVDEGEPYEEAAKRELFEEIGVETDNMQEIGYYYREGTFKSRKLNCFNKVYKCVVSQTPKKLETEEVTAVQWFTIEEVKKLLSSKDAPVTDGLLQIISKYY